MSAGVYGVMIVRNEVDLIEINLRYHLSLGLERILIVDNGSTDGTRDVLERLSREDPRIRWRPDEGHIHQAQMTTALAREAYYLGAKWVMPIDADEFWYSTVPLEGLLDQTEAHALQVSVVNFVQRQDQLDSVPSALRYVTRRIAEPVEPVSDCRRLVESRQISFIAAAYPPKCLSRASASLRTSAGNHIVRGIDGPIEKCDRLLIMHVPLRSMSVLKSKADYGRRVMEAGHLPGESWHLRRWCKMAEEGTLEQEWQANSYAGDSLDLCNGRHRLIYDPRLRDAILPWLPEPQLDGASVGKPDSRATDQPLLDSPVRSEVEMQAAYRAVVSVLHDETREAHNLRATLREAHEQRMQTEAEVQRQAAEAESQRRRAETLECRVAELDAALQKQREETQSIGRAFTRIASSRLARMAFAVSATAVTVRQASAKPQCVARILRDFAKDQLPRLWARPVRAVVDVPVPGATVNGILAVSGWAFSWAAGIESVSVLLSSGKVLAEALDYGFERPDVTSRIPWALSARCGFAGTVPIRDLAPGLHSIIIRVRDHAGNTASIQRTIVVREEAPTGREADEAARIQAPADSNEVHPDHAAKPTQGQIVPQGRKTVGGAAPRARRRILISTQLFYPFEGGSEKQGRLLARNLRKRGLDVTYIAERLPGQPSFEMVDGVPVYRLPGLARTKR